MRRHVSGCLLKDVPHAPQRQLHCIKLRFRAWEPPLVRLQHIEELVVGHTARLEQQPRIAFPRHRHALSTLTGAEAQGHEPAQHAVNLLAGVTVELHQLTDGPESCFFAQWGELLRQVREQKRYWVNRLTVDHAALGDVLIGHTSCELSGGTSKL